ncbi:hypothetical protein HPP92_001602 [Vanilla planifolia]|uniref:Uncharacterized protein n=1 Tax=Vanilla planifolia TaxID=51239 RepID=A0A835RZL5_VANPL|nr:hypothetical protein HPP92_001602 [Vanilla planifolia]
MDIQKNGDPQHTDRDFSYRHKIKFFHSSTISEYENPLYGMIDYYCVINLKPLKLASAGSTVFPRRGGPRQTNNDAPAVKLLSNVEKLRLLTKAEKAGLLSLAGELGLHFHRRKALASSKAEELGVLSAVTDPNTPTVLLALSLVGSCWAPPASICAGGECRGGCRAGRRGLGERRRWIGGIRCVKLRGEIAEMLRFAHVVLEISLFQIQMF